MSLKSIQLATISPSNRAEGKFTVDVHSDDGNQLATFDCDSERDAVKLRDAIREHAARLRRVADYRSPPVKRAGFTCACVHCSAAYGPQDERCPSCGAFEAKATGSTS